MKRLILIILFGVFYPVYINAQTDAGLELSNAAIERTTHFVIYDGGWKKLDYPWGDVPDSIGVCTDLVIRSYRNAFDVDLQKDIHEDMKSNFNKYPSKRIWGNTIPDRNIDHRRTQNLECFLKRKSADLPITDDPNDYKPGDLVFWADIASGHVGIVVNQYTNEGVPKVVHNIGAGPICEDFLFSHKISGHYRWLPTK